MDAHQFDRLTKILANRQSRRRVLGGAGGGLMAGLLGLTEQHVASAFICREPGALCGRDAHCCSDRCDVAGTWRCLCPDPSQKLCGRTCAGCCNDDDCGANENCCNGTCTNVSTDTNHCGDCITVCPSDIDCSGGRCQLLQAGSLCESNEQCASGNCSPYELCSNPPTCTEYTDYSYCFNP